MRSVADHIAAFLNEKGVTHAFGIIGAGNVALFDAIARLGKTEIVCVHHEQAAVMAATYWGRTRRTCGVAVCTTGAGSSNAITGILAAHMDSAPVLVLTGNEPSKYLEAQATRVVGVQGYRTAVAAGEFCKLAVTVQADKIAKGLLYAMWQTAIGDDRWGMSTPRPGPVWLDFPRDVFNAMV